MIENLSYFSYCSYHIESQYHKKQNGENCPTEAVIVTKVTCEEALNVLKLKVSNLNVNQKNRPAGCYWRSDNTGYFNNVLDPSSTNTNEFGARGGVCSLTGKD